MLARSSLIAYDLIVRPSIRSCLGPLDCQHLCDSLQRINMGPRVYDSMKRELLIWKMENNRNYEIQREVTYAHEQHLGDSMIWAKEQAENAHHDLLFFVFFILLILSIIGFGATVFLHKGKTRKERLLYQRNSIRGRWSGWN